MSENMIMADLLKRAVPFLRDAAEPYDDDGSNEPLELARDVENFLDTLPPDESALESASLAFDGAEGVQPCPHDGVESCDCTIPPVVTHTKGPWEYQENSDAYTHIVRAPNNVFICQLQQDTSGIAEANARLIAAAPDLLGAAERVTAAFRGLGMADGVIDTLESRRECEAAILVLDAAIKKATGESA